MIQYPATVPRSSSKSPTRVLRRKLAEIGEDEQDTPQDVIDDILHAQSAYQDHKKPIIAQNSKEYRENISSDQFSQFGPPSSEEAMESNHHTPRIRNAFTFQSPDELDLTQIPETARDIVATEVIHREKRPEEFIDEPERGSDYIKTDFNDLEGQDDFGDIEYEKEVSFKRNKYDAESLSQHQSRGRSIVPKHLENDPRGRQENESFMPYSDSGKLSNSKTNGSQLNYRRGEPAFNDHNEISNREESKRTLPYSTNYDAEEASNNDQNYNRRVFNNDVPTARQGDFGQTSERSKTRKLPPPDVSVTIAKNFELTAQKLPSCALRVMAIFL